jgi:hypothetical protein
MYVRPWRAQKVLLLFLPSYPWIEMTSANQPNVNRQVHEQTQSGPCCIPNAGRPYLLTEQRPQSESELEKTAPLFIQRPGDLVNKTEAFDFGPSSRCMPTTTPVLSSLANGSDS